MSTPAGAVFLSYASQDADAARRICDALRASGIEVWFDQTELRGGDLWDRQIHDRIHDCRLFIPVISANTERRDEGFFRREWSLAADRTRDMAEKKTFLVPVVVDDTPERGASVPDKFRHVQWSRLPGGAASQDFVARIAALLGTEGVPTTPAQTETDAARGNSLQAPAAPPASALGGARGFGDHSGRRMVCLAVRGNKLGLGAGDKRASELDGY